MLQLLAGPAPNASFRVAPEPFGIVRGPDAAVYFTDVSNHQIFRIDEPHNTIDAVVGNGDEGSAGDGGHATNATLRQPYELRFADNGDLVFVDMTAHVIRRVDASSRVIQTIAGTGTDGFSGDGGPATQAALFRPHSIEFDANGLLYIADIGNHRVRRINANETIDTIAGTGEEAPTTIGAPVDGNAFFGPRAVAFEPDGAMILVLREGNAIYRLSADRSRVFHVAGTGEKGYAGDGGSAVSAMLSGPKGLTLAPDGSIIIADTESHTIRKIAPDATITTLAGNGEAGDSLDPSKACLNRPHGVFVEPSGNVLIGDSDNRRVLRLVVD
ncbi:MAG: hypothetical protein AAF493_00060 [Pseudomonadota bacterium]